MAGLSKKQRESLFESTARINIWEGAVRSGKTYVSLWRFLKELSQNTGENDESEGEYCIITRTFDSFKRNIKKLLEQMISSDVKHYLGLRELKIWGKKVHIIGADDERAENKIRGPTFAGAYVDEATIIPESVFKMLISRCAMKNAKIFATTNPDSPFHWLKRDFLEGNPDVKSWQFTLDDNPDLTQGEKDYLKRQYKGIWYQRFIQGLWVQAQGAVYDFFDPNLHVIDFPPGFAEFYICGIDYGTTNACSFVLIGINTSKYPNMWVEDVYYFDSKTAQRQKTDSEYTEDFKKFASGRNIKAIYIDPSAASFKLEMQRSGISGLFEAKNEVLDGIRLVSNYFTNGTLKICRRCDILIKEMQSYVWDPKCAKTGEDKPLKQSDHSLDAMRYAVYTHLFGKVGSNINANDLDRMFEETRGRGQDLPLPFRDIPGIDTRF